jgi:hypothetical protein
MKYITIRHVPAELARALEKERRRRGTSLNQTMLDLLAQALGVAPARIDSNGLKALGGGWTAEQFEQFERAVAATEQIDAEQWGEGL